MAIMADKFNSSSRMRLSTLAVWLLAVAANPVFGAIGNPIIDGWYADPQIRRYDDKYWLFPTYSGSYSGQPFFDVFSSSDLSNWTKHDKALKADDISWAHSALWAPDAHEKDGKYYLFFSANDTFPVGGSRTGTVVRAVGDPKYGGIGVAVSDKPEGPYRDLIGKPLVDQFWNGAQPIDQYVFEYKGEWYMLYGGWGRCNLVKLAPDFKSLLPLEDGKMWRDMTPPDYVEGSVMFERRGRWYFMYSGGSWGKDNYRINYCVGDSPFGPFEFKGTVLSSQKPIATGAGHNSVICVPGTDTWYICYHRRPIPNRSPKHRVTCLDRMYFDENGDIKPVVMTKGPRPTGIVNVAELLDANGKTDVSAALQRIIDMNPNQTLWFPDGVYPLSKPICTSADPARAVSLHLSDFAVLRAMPGWTHSNAMVRLGGIHPKNDNRSTGSVYGLRGGVIDGAGVATAISIESGRETRVQNVSIKRAHVGIHVKKGANSGSADCDIRDIDMTGDNAPGSIGLLVEAHDNTFSNFRMVDFQTGVRLRGSGNFLTNIHPLLSGISNQRFFDDTIGFDDNSNNNSYQRCYSDQFSTGWLFGPKSDNADLDGCIAYWYDSNPGKRHTALRCEGQFKALVDDLWAGFRDTKATNAVLLVGEEGGHGVIRDIRLVEDRLNAPDDRFRDHLTGRLHP